ncbi:MAG: hypothetical protein C4K47_10320 [Candidatus Thorarchaeota archaeon]|nr:MAG: hypothetical protein C4K47_10320 [Candidatus Thorarchaeota archaeon]
MVSATKDRREVNRAAALSVGAAAFLTSMKLVIGIVSGSLGILSEALHSGLDMSAAIITFTAVKRAARAPDLDHNYGYGKVENFAALAETLILWFTSGWIIFEAIRRIQAQEWPEATFVGVLVMATSIFVDYERSRMLYRTAHKHGSQALEADALHFSTDMISSTVVLIGLGFVWIGVPQADPVAAMGVAVVIFFVSARLGKRSYDMLTDRAPMGVRERIGQICSQVPGVIECRRVRTRTAGPQLFIDVLVIVDELLARSGAHVIADAIEKGLAGRVERIDVVVHMEPMKREGMLGPHMNVYSELQYLAEADPVVQGLHNVRVYDMSDGVHIAADLEMPPSLTLDEAHKASDMFEATLREHISNIRSVTLHLESVRKETAVRNVTEEDQAIVKFIKTTVESETVARDCHDIIVREDENGLVLSLDCRAEGGISLIESHTIAERVERLIKGAFPKVNKVFVHVEPLTQD